jgi:hypothetical protein
MIKIMANENDEQWAISPGIVHETVRVAKAFLLSGHGQTHIKTKSPRIIGIKTKFPLSKQTDSLKQYSQHLIKICVI